MVNLNEYQKFTRTTAIYKPEVAMEYLITGLFAEVGEIADKHAKYLRDGNININDFLKELGDVMWFITRLADENDAAIEDIIEANMAKLKSRQERGVIGGSGDNR